MALYCPAIMLENMRHYPYWLGLWIPGQARNDNARNDGTLTVVIPNKPFINKSLFSLTAVVIGLYYQRLRINVQSL